MSIFPLYDLRQGAGLASVMAHNEKIILMLDKLIDHTKGLKATCVPAERKGHGFRLSSFVKARDAIKDCKTQLMSGTQAKKLLVGVGDGVAKRIDEFLSTGTLAELNSSSSQDERSHSIMELMQITGIGEVKATQLHDEYGIKSVMDLLQKYKSKQIGVAKNQLTAHIAVGLTYYADLQERIPWEEVNQLRQLFESTIHRYDSSLMTEVCGSYRRKTTTCGDIDLLICNPLLLEDTDVEKHSQLESLVKFLTQEGLLVGHLTEHGKTKYMGVCKIPHKTNSKGRRIDIRFVSRQAWASAILYFTGSGKFNKLMRYKANERGYTISEYGIFEYINGIKGEKIIVRNEHDIFNLLNFVYLTPEEREF